VAGFDEGKVIGGPFLAVVISENGDDTDYDVPQVASYSILLVSQIDTQHAQYKRVGDGEIMKPEY